MREASSHLRLSGGSSTRKFAPSPVAGLIDDERPFPQSETLDPIPRAWREHSTDTLAVYADRWLGTLGGQLRERTLAGYRSQLRLHVLPALGKRPIAELNEDDILELIAELQAAGYTGWTIRTILTPLSRLLSHAVRRGVIASSPISRLDRTERPAVWAREQRILGRDEIALLLECAPTRFRTVLATAIFSGLRQGELLALTWADVDFEQGVLRVRKSLDRQQRRLDLKTRNAMRDVVLMPALARLLQEHKNASGYSGAGNYVFVSQRGTPLYWRNLSRRALQPALRKAGIAPLRWHDLRHTYASLLIAQGANIVYASRQLGHGSSDITLRCYSHLFDQAEHAARTRDALENMFGEMLSGELAELVEVVAVRRRAWRRTPSAPNLVVGLADA